MFNPPRTVRGRFRREGVAAAGKSRVVIVQLGQSDAGSPVDVGFAAPRQSRGCALE